MTVESTISEPFGAMQAKVFYDHLVAYNWNMEEATGGAPDHWASNTAAEAPGGATGSSTNTYSNAQARSGSYSLKMTKASAGYGTYSNKGAATSTNGRIPCRAGDAVYAQVYVYSTGTWGSGDEAYPMILFYTAAGALVSSSLTYSKSTTAHASWAVTYCYGVVPATATEMTFVNVYCNGSGSADAAAYYDDAQLLMLVGIAKSVEFSKEFKLEYMYQFGDSDPVEISNGAAEYKAKLGLWTVFMDAFELANVHSGATKEFTLHVQYTHYPPSGSSKKRVYQLNKAKVKGFSHKVAEGEISTEDLDIMFCSITQVDSGVF